MGKTQANIFRRSYDRLVSPFRKPGVVVSLKLGGLLLLIGGAVWCGWLGWRSIAYRDEFMISPATLKIEVPSWARTELVEDIKTIPELHKRFSLLEPCLTHRIARYYERSPWVIKVNYVKKELPNKVRMKFTLRRPITAIKTGNDFQLVDEECVVLSKALYKWPDEQVGSLLIQSNRLLTAPSPGKKWDNDSVKAGVDLVRFLKHNRIADPLKIMIVDVTNLGRRRITGESDIVLFTESGMGIKWGCSPLCREPRELSDWEKLQNLLSVVKAEGPDLSHLEYIDVRWPKPTAKAKATTAATGVPDALPSPKPPITAGARSAR
ncbi:MAG: hypothetical protein FJ279_34325 [Planctomycetes bacterium]|nr:hypothetical protein [Planctomycetota bacterium]MBM4081591.1 hypothetical protein [Planctomycetota bacterium]MBM4085959.1 hypothetical protein [Planctomycetota bacterium]